MCKAMNQSLNQQQKERVGGLGELYTQKEKVRDSENSTKQGKEEKNRERKNIEEN